MFALFCSDKMQSVDELKECCRCRHLRNHHLRCCCCFCRLPCCHRQKQFRNGWQKYTSDWCYWLKYSSWNSYNNTYDCVFRIEYRCFLCDMDRRCRRRRRLRCTNKHVTLPQLIFEHQRCWDSCSYHCILVVDLVCFCFRFRIFCSSFASIRCTRLP